MRLGVAAVFTLAATMAGFAATACGARSDMLDDLVENEDAQPAVDATPHDARKVPVPDTGSDTSYVPLTARCVRDGGAPIAFVPDPDASVDAAHPRAPQVVSSGGAVVSLPTFVPITFPGDDLTNEAEDFINSVGCTDYWRTIATDYGVGEAVGGPPVHLTETAPTSITDNQIQLWIADKVANDATFPKPDASTVYVLFYPSGTSITLQGAQSCQAFGGYHNSAQAGGMQVPYAIIPRCGFFNGLSGINALTAVTSHELIEAVTDPVPEKNPAYQLPEPDGWGAVFAGGGEVGDMCEFKSDAFFLPTGYPFHVQRTWTNKTAFNFDDPCQPALAGPFFAAAPSFTTSISVDVGLGPQQAPGVTIPLGQSVTVDVVAFANGSVPAWQLQTFDSIQLRGGPAELGLSLDKISVVDGDVAHLKITRKRNPQAGVSAFAVVSSNGSRQAYFWGMAN